MNDNYQPVDSSLPNEDMVSEIPMNDNDQPASSCLLHGDTASEKQLASGGKKWHTFGGMASTYWLFETFCGILSLACLIAIAAVLYAFNGRTVPTWHHGITLNTIVSLLASAATFSLFVPVTAGLSQLKWLRFCRKGPLSDFEMLENASRGPAGSIALLLRWRAG